MATNKELLEKNKELKEEIETLKKALSHKPKKHQHPIKYINGVWVNTDTNKTYEDVQSALKGLKDV